MPSFDVVSKLDWAEVMNAMNQAQKELIQRFDFKNTGAKIEKLDASLVITAMGEDRAKAAYEVLREKLIRRKVSLKHFEAKDPVFTSKGGSKIVVEATEGIASEKAKVIIRLIKDSKLKVQASIQEDTVRISGKNRDDLQAAIALLRAQKDDEALNLDLQFLNFRD
ncbi:MAG: YajQ family cyclic di-GMP-binding protein [Polyangiaceae bacterium]|nr:YajQ family cyclic di-GMP-binding protein [Polyangiaceae bacterium]